MTAKLVIEEVGDRLRIQLDGILIHNLATSGPRLLGSTLEQYLASAMVNDQEFLMRLFRALREGATLENDDRGVVKVWVKQ